jgi:hypothetical protein
MSEEDFVESVVSDCFPGLEFAIMEGRERLNFCVKPPSGRWNPLIGIARDTGSLIRQEGLRGIEGLCLRGGRLALTSEIRPENNGITQTSSIQATSRYVPAALREHQFHLILHEGVPALVCNHDGTHSILAVLTQDGTLTPWYSSDQIPGIRRGAEGTVIAIEGPRSFTNFNRSSVRGLRLVHQPGGLIRLQAQTSDQSIYSLLEIDSAFRVSILGGLRSSEIPQDADGRVLTTESAIASWENALEACSMTDDSPFPEEARQYCPAPGVYTLTVLPGGRRQYTRVSDGDDLWANGPTVFQLPPPTEAEAENDQDDPIDDEPDYDEEDQADEDGGI